MAITRLGTGSSFKSLVKSDSFLAGNPSYVPPSFESIATATGTGSSGTISFTSIPSTYNHLQIRINAITTSAGQAIYARLNGDSAKNYPQHQLYGDGATVTSSGETAAAAPAFIRVGDVGSGTSTTLPMVGIVDLIDYASTTKNKTLRNFGGIDKNGSGAVDLLSGVWLSTSAINQVDLILSGGSFATSTSISLYGIKGA